MKNVLVIAPYRYLPVQSGGQKFIAQFLRHLGHHTNLHVISVPSNDRSLVTDYQLHPILKPGFSRYYDRSLLKKITGIAKEMQAEIIIWEHPYYWWLASAIRKRTGASTFIHTHNIEYQRFRSMGKWWWPLLKPYEKRAFREADGIFFITPEDRDFAIKEWNIPETKCIDLPFGIDQEEEPADRMNSRIRISSKHGIEMQERILFFNGLLNYKPNIDAVRVILQHIDPMLEKKGGLAYRILVCGKDLPADLISAIGERKNILYAGFTDRIDEYCKASDILLNPVLSGGGIKTKMVEAIGYGTTVISTASGAIGIDRKVCGQKLVIVPDGDWEAFTGAVINNAGLTVPTPPAYYEKYNWESIIDQLMALLG